mmetsp:Transcript_8259/g.18463  ORF Transcript_8259/g.18463 Transcript_8259/m.18463 type:complete len:92 (+) Transcript_8259:106-381(+)
MSQRSFEGINNKMPGPDAGTGRGYVILGDAGKWTTAAPTSIEILSQTCEVKKEEGGFMARGLSLQDGAQEATVTLADGSKETITVNVMSVC